MLRSIREISPSWVVGENVRGLTNWNGGLVFDEVQADLEAIGYEVTPFLLPACAVNAPHRRDRIWFIAHSPNNGYKNRCKETTRKDRCSKQGRMQQFERMGWERISTDTNSNGFNQCNSEYEINASERRINAQRNIDESYGNGNASDSKNIRQEYALENGELERGRFGKSYQRNTWNSFPSKSPICTGDDGFSNRLDGITFPKWRNESIKAAGNAIVPQVALMIFKAIEQYDRI